MQGEEKKKIPYARRVIAGNINFPWPKRIAKENQCMELLLYTDFWLEFGNQKSL